MIDITISGTIVEVKKISNGAAGPSVKIVYEDRKGTRNEVWFFAEDLSMFNEVVEQEE
jgi:hypothetical protein